MSLFINKQNCKFLYRLINVYLGSNVEKKSDVLIQITAAKAMEELIRQSSKDNRDGRTTVEKRKVELAKSVLKSISEKIDFKVMAEDLGKMKANMLKESIDKILN